MASGVNNYMKYSGMAFQMAGILLVGVLAGRWLDAKYATEKPWFTLALVVFALFGAFYLTLKDLIVDNKK